MAQPSPLSHLASSTRLNTQFLTFTCTISGRYKPTLSIPWNVQFSKRKLTKPPSSLTLCISDLFMSTSMLLNSMKPKVVGPRKITYIHECKIVLFSTTNLAKAHMLLCVLFPMSMDR